MKDRRGGPGEDGQPPAFPTARRGEDGRIGKGRFNRSFAMEKDKLLQGTPAAKPADASRTNNGFKSKFKGRSSHQQNALKRKDDKHNKPRRRNV